MSDNDTRESSMKLISSFIIVLALLLVTTKDVNAIFGSGGQATEVTQILHTSINTAAKVLDEVENFSDFQFENLQPDEYLAVIQEMIKSGNQLSYLSEDINGAFIEKYPSYEDYRSAGFNPELARQKSNAWRESTKNSVVSLLGSMGYSASSLKDLEKLGAIELLNRFSMLGSRNQQLKGLGAITAQVNNQLQGLRQSFLDQMQMQQEIAALERDREEFGRAMFDSMMGIDVSGELIDAPLNERDGGAVGEAW